MPFLINLTTAVLRKHCIFGTEMSAVSSVQRFSHAMTDSATDFNVSVRQDWLSVLRLICCSVKTLQLRSNCPTSFEAASGFGVTHREQHRRLRAPTAFRRTDRSHPGDRRPCRNSSRIGTVLLVRGQAHGSIRKACCGWCFKPMMIDGIHYLADTAVRRAPAMAVVSASQ